MKLWVILLLFSPVFGQNTPETSVFLFDIIRQHDSISFDNGQNISRNDGYNNQPSFYDENTLLYARNRNGQTDIGMYAIAEDSTSFFNETLGGEFSPMQIPDSQNIAAVRLDEDGTQRLYKYSATDSTQLLSAAAIGYFDFYSQNEILTAVVQPDGMNLHFMGLKTQKDSLIITNVGRGVRKVPGSDFMSYTLVTATGDLDLYLLDMGEGMTSYFVCTLPIGIQDYTWLNSTEILIGSRNQLFIYDTLGEAQWAAVAKLEIEGLQEITRLAVSPDAKKVAVVAKVPKAKK